jgi:hypothetical protein
MKLNLEFIRSNSSTETVEMTRAFSGGRPNPSRQQSKRILMSGLLIMLLFALGVFTAPTPASAGEIAIGISLRVGPPPIPVYTQPACPGPGFMWTPGYWAFDPANGYYWVPGTWVEVPSPGMYWTPGYWGWGGSVFVWHAGYWGPHVGFYGGVNYGFGYTGVGFVGGEWRGERFFYNRSVANIGGSHIDNVYYRSVPNNFAVNRVSYNGGSGGLNVRPGREELVAEHDRHFEATSLQQQHESAAHNDHSQFASYNHGRPGVAATGRPGEFHGSGAVAPVRAGGSVSGGEYRGSNSEHATGFSGYHNTNPSGGVTHQTTTSNTYSPGSSSGSMRGSTPGEFHSSAPPARSGAPGAPPPSGNSSHAGQSQPHGSQPGGGGHGHESEPRH